MLPLMSTARTRSSGAFSLTKLAIGCATPSSNSSKSCCFSPRTNWPFCVTMTGTSTASVWTCSMYPRSFVRTLAISRRPSASVATTRM